MTRIVLSFGDARFDEYDAIKLASKYGVKCTLNVTTAYVENSAPTDAGDCPAMTKEQVLELCDDGNVEIAGHSHTHVNDFNDIVKGQRILEGWLSTNEKLGFASPHSQLNLNENPLNKFKEANFLYVRKSQFYDKFSPVYRYIRKISRICGFKWPLYITYKNTLAHIVEDGYFLHGVPVLLDNSFDQIKYIVNKAIENKTDCLLILHSICKKGHPLEHDLYSWEWEKFEALCVYIHSLEVKGKLKSVLSKDLILK